MNWLLYAVALLLVSALAALLALRSARLASTLAATGAFCASLLGVAGALGALSAGSVERLSVPWSVPDGRLTLGLDPLSAFFAIPLFVLGGLGALYGRSYLLAFAARRSLAPPWAAYCVLVASMALVLLARHALVFLVAWELMSLSGYLLITFEHERAEVRRAGFVYLIATHIGVAFLTLLFLLLGKHAASLDFGVILATPRPAPALAALLFGCALLGFGAKAGLVPLHVWLPEAHAAAPSHVSALMSGVLVKMGIYGILRVSVLLGGPAPWWGPLLMCIGIAGGALGISLAAYQRDLKRALAYSSVENVGLIVLGLGTAFWGASAGQARIAAFGLFGALLHVYNHTLMKGLLFLGAGSVLHGAGTKDLEQLGGLAKRMPFTALSMVVGASAIAGLPPLNGFVSEWLLYMGLLRGALDAQGTAGVVVVGAVAALAIIGAVAALSFVRLLGVALLGEPRSDAARHAHESPPRDDPADARARALGACLRARFGVARAVARSHREPTIARGVRARSAA